MSAVLVVSACLSVICIGLWASSQGDEQNAHSLWVHSEPGVSAKNLAVYERTRRERRGFGWLGLGLGLVALACAVWRSRQ
jgi:hypothetical protein